MNIGLTTAWLGAIGLVTWRAFQRNHRPPAPSELAATVIVYGTLSLISGDAAKPAAVFGWGLLAAGWLNLYDPTLASLSKSGSAGLLEQSPKGTPSPGPATQQSGANIAQAGRLA